MRLDGLNDMQKRAVEQVDGPLLIIAGAGSGKTRVLTHRIAYMIENKQIDPYNILAITFTNKAAREMKERVEAITDLGGQVWVSTFHSMCVRILRRFADRIGYSNSFTIYDSDDQRAVVRAIIKRLNIDSKMVKDRAVLSSISRAKNDDVSPEEYRQTAYDFGEQQVARIYAEYQNQLKINNAMDFDDLLFKTVELFEKNQDVLYAYQSRFRYIMVDEYQDTNGIQFRLVKMLASAHRNICVVGDDDQSIYRFRGADITNILNFETVYDNALVIKLEQNYRSTQNILDAANAVIKHNSGRKDKTLWTSNGEGDKVKLSIFDTAYQEAEYVAASIRSQVREGWSYNDIAVLYRTNAQSRLLEEKLIMANIPYRIYGGQNFYARREIKDILSYLKVIDNGSDSEALNRVINVPKRGIGATSLERVSNYANERGINTYEALKSASVIPGLGRATKKIEEFVNLIEDLKMEAMRLSIEDLTREILDRIDYDTYLVDTVGGTDEEIDSRRENINELLNKIIAYEAGDLEDDFDDSVEANPEMSESSETADSYADGQSYEDDESQEKEKSLGEKTLSGFLSEVSLIADIDNLDESASQVMLMTLHSAKGLEFPLVYISGMEDGLFPGYMSISSGDESDMEEERRLAYVGITRAKQELYLSAAKSRMVNGNYQYNALSRFVKEIPKKYIEKSDLSSYADNDDNDEEVETSGFDRFNSYASQALSASGKTARMGRSAGSSYTGTYSSSYSGSSHKASTSEKSARDESLGDKNPLLAMGKAAVSRYGDGKTIKEVKSYTKINSNVFDLDSKVKQRSKLMTNYGSKKKIVEESKPNEKVGFGKAFPSDLFASAKSGSKTAKSFEAKIDSNTSGKSSNLSDAKALSDSQNDTSQNKASGGFNGLGYDVGDQVSHIRFGKGTVTAIEDATRDYMVSVDFENFGARRMLAAFAKLQKIDKK